jgi:cytochrome c peroxidase
VTRQLLPIPLLLAGLATSALAASLPLGLPPVPVPADNPQTPEKIALGERLFHDTRFSSTGTVSCATCHAPGAGFTDGPLKTSKGIEDKVGTRNAPTVLNAAYFSSQFWDGRSPSLEDQALHPFVNPIEMGLKDHQPILDVIKADETYTAGFKAAFGIGVDQVGIAHVTQAIAAFERTLIAGDSPFDRWFYAGESSAMTEQQVQGYELFIGKARCVSCHVIEQTSATFTDNRFHNVGVGFNRIQQDAPTLAQAYIKANRTLEEVDVDVLTDPRSSELGRFAVDRQFDGMGAFKTSTLRNIALTAPYMHDGSIETLEKVVEHYNNGGVTNEGDPVNDFLSGGIRPLNLTAEEQAAVVAFLNALTSPVLPGQNPPTPAK